MLRTWIQPLRLALVTACAFQPLTSAEAQSPAATDASRVRNVAIVVFPSVELLDFAGPGEVFATARTATSHGFHVYTVAESRAPVTSMGFVTVTPQYTLEDCPKPDIVVVPGGDVPLGSDKLKSWVKARAQDTELMMSVCNGALVYAQAGLLDGLEVTTHKSALQGLSLIAPTAKVYTNRRFVDNGRVMTSAGISAGIDGALHVVQRMLGEESAWRTARYMEYDWRPDEIERLHAQPGRAIDGADALTWASSIHKRGLPSALEEYRKMSDAPTETVMNRWGYELLQTGKAAEATALLKLVAAAFPTSCNASDSLSEAYERSGDTPHAIEAAEQCIARLEADKGVDAARRSIIRNNAASRIARHSGEASKLKFECPPCQQACDSLSFLEGGRCPGCPMELREKSASGGQQPAHGQH